MNWRAGADGAVMDASPENHADPRAERTTRVLAHLDGSLRHETLEALQQVWRQLETAATTPHAHQRAVNERLMWKSLNDAA